MLYQALQIIQWKILIIRIYYIYIIWIGGVYGISTITGYLMLNPLYTYTQNIYDRKHILLITFLNVPDVILFCTHLNCFKDYYLTLIVLFKISHLFAHS